MNTMLVLTLDEDDAKAVHKAIAYLQRHRDDKGSYLIPEGESCIAGASLAEVCRGYLEMLGEWPGLDDKEQAK